MKTLKNVTRLASSALLVGSMGLASSVFAQGLILPDNLPPTRLPSGFGNVSAATPTPTPQAAEPEPQQEPASGIYLITNEDIYGDTPPGPYENIYGVFIGVGDYQNQTPLANTVNDAVRMAETMERVTGLKDPIVLLDADATSSKLDEALLEIGEKATNADLVVFYFSGHGLGVGDDAGNKNGFLMLHGSPDGSGIVAGDRTDMLDMATLNERLSLARIDAKHKMIVLDCCFGGFGAENIVRTRGGLFGDKPDDKLTAEQAWNRPVSYAMSAGDAAQEVLDFTPVYEGYGILSGVLIQALERWEEIEKFDMLEVDGQPYMDVALLFQSAVRPEVPRRAKASLQYFLDNTYGLCNLGDSPDVSKLNCPPTGIDLSPCDAGGYELDVEQNLCDISRLYRYLQAPQAQRIAGGGNIILPLLTSSVEKTPTPTPTATPTPTPEPTPEIVDDRPDYLKWAEAVARKYGSREYGLALAEVLTLLNEGEPAYEGDSTKVSVLADVLARPRVDNRSWQRLWFDVYGGDRFNPRDVDAMKRFVQFKKEWRDAHGVNWKTVMPYGDTLSPNYSLRFRVANLEDQPLHYYMIAIDDAGILQWIGPNNTSAWAEYSSGRDMLPARNEAYVFPEPNPRTGEEYFQNITSEVDQKFFLVASRVEWPELEQALLVASEESHKIYEKQSATNAESLESEIRDELSPFGFTTRAVSATTSEAVDPEFEELFGEDLTTEKRADGHFLMLTWDIEIVSEEQLQPELKVASNE